MLALDQNEGYMRDYRMYLYPEEIYSKAKTIPVGSVWVKQLVGNRMQLRRLKMENAQSEKASKWSPGKILCLRLLRETESEARVNSQTKDEWRYFAGICFVLSKLNIAILMWGNFLKFFFK